MSTEIQTGSSILRPRARLIKTIGEDLISSDVVAVMELVKNSYDADASIISIRFEGPVEDIQIDKKRTKKVMKASASSITIADDGKGMSLETIQNAWMEPATIAKKIETVSPGKSRRYTGEKGIGRFASAKLSSNLQIVTKVAEDNEVVVNFDWADFSDDELYLDEVSTDWEVRVPSVITDHGTVLRLEKLNSVWDAEKIRDLKVALSRLVNPVAPVTDFLIELIVPDEFAEYSGLVEPPESISHPDYSVKGSVNAYGLANLKYKSRNTDELTQSIQLARDSNPTMPFQSGPFTFEFRVWDREPDSLERLAKEVGSTTKNIKSDLNELVGVSIYRDKFRVLPYGDPKNDWLRLNARRVNNPTMRVGDNQIIGYISISRDSNPALTDQSNREGIVESLPFSDLQEQIKLILNELEVKRYAERPRREDTSANDSLYSAFTVAPIAEAVSRKLPQDKEVLDLVKQTQERIDAGVKKVQEVLSRYRRLSTLGILIDSILHDGGHFLLNIDSEIRLLEKEMKKSDRDEKAILAHLAAIQDQRKVMAQLFKRVEPFGGRKKGRPASIVIEDSIRNVFELSRYELNRQNISVELRGSSNTVTIDDTELQMIIVNLLQNSIYWLGKVTHERKIIVQVERTNDELSIVFSDSGPGVPEEKAPFIFDPYFTGREDGIGLGLTIIGELVSEYNGDFYLINNGPLDGATFKIVFRKRI